jgi:hypothetical protein
MENRDLAKEEAIHIASHIASKDAALKVIIDEVVEGYKHPKKIYRVTGEWIVQFHNLVREYAKELEELAPLNILG